MKHLVKIKDIKKTNATEDGFLTLTGYVLEAEQPMIYYDFMTGGTTKEVIPMAELEKLVDKTTGIILTQEHPWEFLDGNNAKYEIKGFSISSGEIEDKKLKLVFKVIDNEIIAKVLDGTRELSAGYVCDMEKSDMGDEWLQKNIKLNHVALVESGRLGEGVGVITLNSNEKILVEDKFKNLLKEEVKNMVKINGKDVKIEDVQKEFDEVTKESKMNSDKLIEKTNECEQLRGKLVVAEKQLSEFDSKIDAEVITRLNSIKEREILVSEAGKFSKIEIKENMSAKDIKEGVLKENGIDVTGKDENYVNGAYDFFKKSKENGTIYSIIGEEKKNSSENTLREKGGLGAAFKNNEGGK